MRSSLLSQWGLFIAAAVVLLLAFSLWSARQSSTEDGISFASLRPQPQKVQRRAQQASALLFRAFHADNYLTYSAISETIATFGEREMKSQARITHAPRSLSIVYLKGDHEGLHSGYNQHWIWRQNHPKAPMQAYAEMERDTNEMVVRRFSLMLENYIAKRRGTEKIGDRDAEVVELRPFQPVDGAQGPGKRLWIDEKTGLTLRIETFNYQMQPVMRSTLSNVDYTPEITEDTFKPPAKILEAAEKTPWVAQEGSNNVEHVASVTGLNPPQPEYLPPGFHFDGVGTHTCRYSGTAYCAALSRYTDGINTLTIFAMKSLSAPGSATAADAKSSTAKNNANGKLESCDFGPGTLVMRDTPHGRLLALADLPSPVLQRVVNSVHAAALVPATTTGKAANPDTPTPASTTPAVQP